VAKKVSSNPSGNNTHALFLAKAIATYLHRQHMTETDLCKWLGISHEQLGQLRLERTPDAASYTTDVASICIKFGVVDCVKLEAIVQALPKQ
jgi:hypothetical protein